MALRVLLADESSTIKKVMQLALQDFAVEVKAVPVGLDVLAVAKTYKPDIVFADVLLTKRNGYEVCGDLKNDPETSHLPVALMWSGFMELDEVKASGCRADRRLEKPFDADALRNIVRDLVPKTRTNALSEYLTFPRLPEFSEPVAEKTPEAPLQDEPSMDLDRMPLGSELNEENIYAIPEDNALDIPYGEEFSQVPLTSPKAHANMMQASGDDGEWSHQDLNKFKIQIPDENSDDFAKKFVVPETDLSHAHVEVSGSFEEVSFDDTLIPSSAPRNNVKPTAPPPVPPPAAAQQQMPRTESVASRPAREPAMGAPTSLPLDSAQVEKIIREQAREMIESICWKILPDIAERVVREEIQKILRESEKSL